MSKQIRANIGFCEFPGDQSTPWDGLPKHKRQCPYIGFIPRTGKDTCCLHQSQLWVDDEGWRRCCDKCTTPHYSEEGTLE